MGGNSKSLDVGGGKRFKTIQEGGTKRGDHKRHDRKGINNRAEVIVAAIQL